MEPRAGVAVFSDDEPVGEILVADDTTENPVMITHGSLAWTVIKRDGRYAVRLRDFDHPALASFPPLQYFPIDPSWRVEGTLERYAQPKRVARHTHPANGCSSCSAIEPTAGKLIRPAGSCIPTRPAKTDASSSISIAPTARPVRSTIFQPARWRRRVIGCRYEYRSASCSTVTRTWVLRLLTSHGFRNSVRRSPAIAR